MPEMRMHSSSACHAAGIWRTGLLKKTAFAYIHTQDQGMHINTLLRRSVSGRRARALGRAQEQGQADGKRHEGANAQDGVEHVHVQPRTAGAQPPWAA